MRVHVAPIVVSVAEALRANFATVRWPVEVDHMHVPFEAAQVSVAGSAQLTSLTPALEGSLCCLGASLG